MTVTDLLKANGIASNDFQAGNIATGLRLWECANDEEKLERARLYREWRNSGIYAKSDTKSCFEKAIAGVPIVKCSVCGESFIPLDDHDFVCGKDRTLECKCGSDDVRISWQIATETKHPYYWSIECQSCGHEITSDFYPVGEMDNGAKEVHTKWLSPADVEPRQKEADSDDLQ